MTDNPYARFQPGGAPPPSSAEGNPYARFHPAAPLTSPSGGDVPEDPRTRPFNPLTFGSPPDGLPDFRTTDQRMRDARSGAEMLGMDPDEMGPVPGSPAAAEADQIAAGTHPSQRNPLTGMAPPGQRQIHLPIIGDVMVPATPEQRQGTISPPPPRSVWDFVKDEFHSVMDHRGIHQRFVGRPAERLVLGNIPTSQDLYSIQLINADRRAAGQPALTEEERQGYLASRMARRAEQVTTDEADWRAQDDIYNASDPAWRSDGSFLGNLLRSGGRLVGGIAGSGLDPVTFFNPGGSIARQIGGNTAANVVEDVVLQGAEGAEGVRDEWDPYQTMFSALAPPVLIGGAYAARGAYRRGRTWMDRRRGIVRDPEGGQMAEPPDMIDAPLEEPGAADNPYEQFGGAAPEAEPRGPAPAARRRRAGQGEDSVDSFMARSRQRESGGDDGAHNPQPGQTASGRYGFTDGTWLSMHRRVIGGDMSVAERMAQKSDGAVQDRVMRGTTESYDQALRGAGQPVTDGNRYLSHFFGPETAIRILRNPEASLSSLLGHNADRIFRVNPNLRANMSGADAIALTTRAMGGRAPEFHDTGAAAADEGPADIGLWDQAPAPAERTPEEIAGGPEPEPSRVQEDLQRDMERRAEAPSAEPAQEPARRRMTSEEVGRDNYLDDVGRHAPRLFRETDIDRGQFFMPYSGASTDMRGEHFFADHRDLATGQDGNRGVMMEFDGPGLQGQVSRGKPTWAHTWDSAGMGEFVLRHNTQQDYQGRLRSFTIARDAPATPSMRERMKRVLKWHEQKGWVRTRNEDGSVTMTRPDAVEAPPARETEIRPSDAPDPQNRVLRPAAAENGPIERQPIPAERRPAVTGAEEAIRTARGREVPTTFEVREADDLISSDHPAYDPDLQPRQRADRATSDAQVAEIASRLDPEQLSGSRLASQGAPIVGPDRLVDSGNGRVQAIRRAYDRHPEQAAAYRKMIEGRGFDLTDFEKPVLVRRHDLQGEDRRAFTREANERDTMSMSSTEQARTDAGGMSDETLQLYRGGGVSDAGNRDFVRRWMDEVASPAERNQLIQADGTISADGIRRIRSSMLAHAFDDPNLVAKITEDPDTEIRAIGNTLTDAAPGLAALRKRVADGELPREYDITPQIAEMAQMIARARADGKPLAASLAHDDMFGGKTDPITEAVTRLMFKDDELAKPRSAADMADGLRHFLQDVDKHSGADLLGGEASPGRVVDVLHAAQRKLEAKDAARTNANGARLFARAQEEGLGQLRKGSEPLSRALSRIADSHPNRHVRTLANRLSTLVGDAEAKYDPDLPHQGRTDLMRDGSVQAHIKDANAVDVVLHEGIHTATLTHYGELLDQLPEGGPIVKELQDLLAAAQRLEARRPSGLDVVRAGLTNTDELLAYGLTSPRFQKWMKGKNTGGLWGRFVDGVRRLAGLAPRYGELLDRVLTAGARMVEHLGETSPAHPGTVKRSLKSEGEGDAPRADDEGVERTPGGIRSLIDGALDVDGLRGDAEAVRSAVGSPVKTLKNFTEPLGRIMSAAMFSNDARLRALAAKFDSEALTEYADRWFARPGHGDSTSRTYHEAVARSATTRMQQMFEAMAPHLGDKLAERRVADLLAEPNKSIRATAAERAAATRLRDLLEETIEYRRDAGEDIGKVTDGYFPRVLDATKVAADRENFLGKAEELYRTVDADDPGLSAQHWFQRIYDEYAGLDGGVEYARGAGGMGSTSAKSREFGKAADELLADYYDRDPFHVLAAYFTGSAQRAEFTRRFGRPGREGSAERAAWTKEHGPTKTQLDVLMDRIKDDVRTSDAKPAGVLGIVENVHKSNLGQMGTRDSFARTATSWLHAWNQLGKMDRTTITSLGELTMGIIRGGPRYGFSFVKDSLQEFARQVRKADPSDGARWAEAVGVANDAMVSQALTSRIEAQHATAGTQKVLHGFYKAIGLHQYTTGTRIAASTMIRKMINTFAGDMTSARPRVRKRAELYLRELGIQDPAEFARRIREEGSPERSAVLADKDPFAQEYGTAVYRGVQQTIMMPSRAEKPTWSAHPVGGLVFSLMGYSYAFKKNVLDRGARLAIRGVKDRDLALLMPAAGLAVMAGFQALNDTYLRPYLFGSRYDFSNETPLEFALRVADRSGFLAGASPFVNAIKAVRYDRDLYTSLSGPVIGSIADAANKFVELYTERNSRNTNTAERNAAAAFYDAFLDPAIDALASARLRGAARSLAVLGTGNREGGVLPADRDAVIDAVAGPRTPSMSLPGSADGDFRLEGE